MIRELGIENCMSFLKPTAVSFLVNQKAPASDKYHSSITKPDRIAKWIAVVGPNASGKSNLLRSISFIKWFMIDSFSNSDAEFSLNPFMLTEGPFGPSTISIEFEHETSIYRFKVVFRSSTVLSEELEVLDLTLPKERRRFHQLFSRKYDYEQDQYIFKTNPDFKLAEGTREIVKKRKNASLISAALLSNHEQSLSIKRYWSKVIPKIKEFGEFPFGPWESSEFYHKNQHFKQSMEKVLSMCDLGISGMDIERVEFPAATPGQSSKQEYYMPFGRHHGQEGKEYRLPFSMESAGTQQIYSLLATLLPVLDSGGLAVIDEIETELHPHLLPALLELFSSSESNPKGAQLIFTTHATSVLASMDKYQVVVVEKDQWGISSASRPDGIRNDDNLYGKYSDGVIGGTPKISPLSLADRP